MIKSFLSFQLMMHFVLLKQRCFNVVPWDTFGSWWKLGTTPRLKSSNFEVSFVPFSLFKRKNEFVYEKLASSQNWKLLTKTKFEKFQLLLLTSKYFGELYTKTTFLSIKFVVKFENFLVSSTIKRIEKFWLKPSKSSENAEKFKTHCNVLCCKIISAFSLGKLL